MEIGEISLDGIFKVRNFVNIVIHLLYRPDSIRPESIRQPLLDMGFP